MIKLYKTLLFIFVLMILSACQISKSDGETTYKGVPLRIAVVGEIPHVRENQINFERLSLDELYHSQVLMYDAVFIMENHLVEASNQKFIKMYRERKIPFFFVGTKAYTIPFINMRNPDNYEIEAERVNNQDNFISGLFYIGEEEGYRGWSFSYPVKYNKIQREKVNEIEIYSSVFKVIETEFK